MKAIPISEIDSLITELEKLRDSVNWRMYFETDVIETLRGLEKKAVPTQPLDITQSTDMVKDFFIRSLEDLKE